MCTHILYYVFLNQHTLEVYLSFKNQSGYRLGLSSNFFTLGLWRGGVTPLELPIVQVATKKLFKVGGKKTTGFMFITSNNSKKSKSPNFQDSCFFVY